jgi:hypothetical protein
MDQQVKYLEEQLSDKSRREEESSHELKVAKKELQSETREI